MTDESTYGTADTMRERGSAREASLLALMRLNRLVLTAGLTVAVFVGFVLAAAVFDLRFAAQIRSGDLVDTMFSSMITAIVTGATLVVSIGQLVISQEDGPLGEQRNRMSNTLDFRGYIEELLDGTAPADPSAFLREIVLATRDTATELRDVLDRIDDPEARSEVDNFTESVISNAETVTEDLDGATFGTFDVLFAALNYNYSWKIFQVDRLTNEYGDHFGETERHLLDELKTGLSMFGPAREHIKTLYFQWELIEFSQLTLYTAVPALLVAGLMFGFDIGSIPGQTLGLANVVWVVGGAFAVTLVPFLLFVSYLLRILTVAKRTLAIGPLILRESQR